MNTFSEPTTRVCQSEGCETILSRFNSATVCSSCSNRLEVGGVRIHLPPPTIVGPRPPAPQRPVLEGAVPLPGPITVTPQRSLEEMLRKPLQPAEKPPAPTCAECGNELPKGHEGWFCRLCAVAGTGDVEIDSSPVEEPAVSEPEPEPGAAKTAPRVVPPRKTLKPRAPHQTKRIRGLVDGPPKRRGRARAFDWDEAFRLRQQGVTEAEVAERLGGSISAVRRAVRAAVAAGGTAPPHIRTPPPAPPVQYDQVKAARIYRESGGNLNEVARQLGCSWDTANSAVARELTAEEMAAVKRPIPRPGGRRFDRAEAVSVFRETRNVDETARRLKVTGEAMRRALTAELGDEYHEILAARTELRAKRKGVAPPAPAALPVSPPQPRAENGNREPDQMPERAELERRIEQIKLLLDDATTERDRLTGEIRALLEEWGDANYRLSRLSDAA